MDKLRDAFIKKERAEIYLLNLEKLKADDSIKDSFYESLKSEHGKARNEAIEKVDRIKAELQKKLEAKKQELALARLNFKYVETKHQAGQLSETEFTRQGRGPKRKVENLEKSVEEIKQLIEATSSSDIRAGSLLKGLNLNMGLSKSKKENLTPRVIPEMTPLLKTEQTVQPTPETKKLELLPIEGSLEIISQRPEPGLPSGEPLTEEVPKPKKHLPPELTITSLYILPDRVISGNDVGIIASVKNIGEQEINYKLELRINEEIKDYQTISLMPGKSEEVTFLIPTGLPGEYQIDIDGQSGKYKVLRA